MEVKQELNYTIWLEYKETFFKKIFKRKKKFDNAFIFLENKNSFENGKIKILFDKRIKSKKYQIRVFKLVKASSEEINKTLLELIKEYKGKKIKNFEILFKWLNKLNHYKVLLNNNKFSINDLISLIQENRTKFDLIAFKDLKDTALFML